MKLNIQPASREMRPFNVVGKTELETLLKRSKLSPSDKELVFYHIEKLKAQKKITIGRQMNIWRHLIDFQALGAKNYPEMNDKDVTVYLNRLYADKRFSPATVRNIVAAVKQFFRFLLKNKSTSLSLEDIQDIKLPKLSGERRVGPKDLIGEDDQRKMLESVTDPKDKAMLAVLFETAFRPIEIAQLRGQDIEWSTDKTMVTLTTTAKTGKARSIPCFEAVPYLKKWIESAPYPIEGEALVFPTGHPKTIKNADGTATKIYRPFQAVPFRDLLKRIAHRAGVKNWKYPYQLRHSRITALARDPNIPESTLSRLSHGGPTTMLKMYITPDQKVLERTLKQVYEQKKEAGGIPSEIPGVVEITPDEYQKFLEWKKRAAQGS